MQSFYEVTDVKMQVTYTRYDVDESGNKRILTEQTVGYVGLHTKEELLAAARARIEPGHEIEVVVNPKINL
jgi:hypothetical protein